MSKPLFEIRASSIQGSGAFATRRIRKGARIVEYVGERITTEEADERYADMSKHEHVVLFIIDKRTVIDGGAGGNEARYFNHSCEPNCQTIAERKRIYIEALRTIEKGEELTYDYHLDSGGEEQTAKEKKRYACLCGAETCRGTMLAPTPEKKPRAARKTAAKKSAAKKAAAKKSAGKKTPSKKATKAPAKKAVE